MGKKDTFRHISNGSLVFAVVDATFTFQLVLLDYGDIYQQGAP
jgi:hypothetical protein